MASISHVFSKGLTRIDSDGEAALKDVSAALVGSPLEEVGGQACNALCSGSVQAHDLVAVAAAIQAIEGALFDAALDDMLPSSPLNEKNVAAADPTNYTPESLRLMPGVQQWLVEVAMSGFDGLDKEVISSGLGLLPALQTNEETQRLAVTLSAWIDDVFTWPPQRDIPTKRWLDLFCRTLLLTVSPPPQPEWENVDGGFHVFGAELQHASHVQQLVVHGVLAVSYTHLTLPTTPYV